MRVLRFVILLLGLVSSLALTPTLAAEKFPSRPIKFVVGFSAGGPTDTAARIMCEWLTPYLGQPCVVENKAFSGTAPIVWVNVDGKTLSVRSADRRTFDAMEVGMPAFVGWRSTQGVLIPEDHR